MLAPASSCRWAASLQGTPAGCYSLELLDVSAVHRGILLLDDSVGSMPSASPPYH